MGERSSEKSWEETVGSRMRKIVSSDLKEMKSRALCKAGRIAQRESPAGKHPEAGECLA